MTTVADQFADTLAAAGVKRIYGIVGDSLNGLTDAIRQQGKIEWVHVRHEEVAAFAAGADAHLSESLAVCAGSCGPGNLHLINGLFDCHRSRVPVLAIAAHIPSAEIGSGMRFLSASPAPRVWSASRRAFPSVTTTSRSALAVMVCASWEPWARYCADSRMPVWLGCMGARVEGLALPKSVESGKLSVNKAGIRWMSVYAGCECPRRRP